MRIVLDTNVLLVSIETLSPFRPIYDAVRSGQLRLLLTTEIYFEYLEKLQEKTNIIVASNITNSLVESETTELVTVYYKWNLIKNDSDDNKFSDCAIAANAGYIVTDNTDFNVLKSLRFPSLKIISAKEMVQLLSNQ